jgi:ribonuclease R
MNTPENKPHSGKDESKVLHGIIKTTGKGMGFVTIEGHEDEIVIEPDFINTALNGDEVEVQITGKYFETKRGRPGQQTSREQGNFDRQAGQVVKILNRAKKQFVGTLVQHDGQIWAKADDRRVYVEFFLPAAVIAASTDPLLKREDKTGIKVLVRITEWTKNQKFPTAEIIQVLGERGDNETEIQSIILDRGIDTTFPDAVIAEAEHLEKTEKPLRAEEIARRRDMRQATTFTCDPVDAKDFDDALSLKVLPDGLFEIGIHIADVSHYVRPGTALDSEALRRSFSVYLVDRTIPMLPEVLSNDLCSLNPHEDKFAFSTIVIADSNGHVKERWFGQTIINSNKRFSYESAQEVLNAGKGELYEELNTLNKIAKVLQKENAQHGAINFEQDEVKFKLDENGKPIDVYKKPRLDTHKLIEEFMLLANREVAAFIFKTQQKSAHGLSIYRIHDLPDQERIEELSLFLKALGFHLPVKQGVVTAKDINALLKSVEGVPEESLIKTATIRSMAKAVYSTKNIGHFGLGFEFYTHFTSPIRRYPDLMIHRILADILHENDAKVKLDFNQFEKISRQASEREVAAAEAERASIKYKQVEFMSAHIGETFDGKISGVTEWGIYVEDARTRCEGMVPLRELGNDYFVFNRRTYTVEGQKTKVKYRLGDLVTYKVMKADLDAKTLDYRIVDSK